MARADGDMIDLEKVLGDAARADIWAVRGHAIQAYASLEQSLFRLFTRLTGMELGIAAIVFFKITNAQARNSIVEKLFQKQYGAEHNLFRNSLIQQLRPIDIERNEIVHWNIVNRVEVEGGETGVELRVELVPPTFWNYNADMPSKDSAALTRFIEKCAFFTCLCNAFIETIMDAKVPADELEHWRRVFSEAIVYPPPANHPANPPRY